MKLLFYLHHPAHFHLFKFTIQKLKDAGHRIFIIATKKDILTNLLDHAGMEYYNILPDGRADNKLSIAYALAKQDVTLLRQCMKIKPDLLLGTSTEICHVGKLLNIPSLFFNEDDMEVIKLVYYLAYPFAKHLICPTTCNTGSWSKKTLFYNGYHELAYLHPKYFKPNKAVVEKYYPRIEKYFILRFAKLKAHHDSNNRGVTTQVAEKIINVLKDHGEVLITSERVLEPHFEKYSIRCNPLDIHHLIAFSSLYIGDSQTMAAEAGVLGVPFIRYNDFVGKIGYLDELETKYHLGFGVLPNNPNIIFEILHGLLHDSNITEKWKKRRDVMLSEKIDVTSYFVWLINNYPYSIKQNYVKNEGGFHFT